jgi:hypothetical protein
MVAAKSDTAILGVRTNSTGERFSSHTHYHDDSNFLTRNGSLWKSFQRPPHPHHHTFMHAQWARKKGGSGAN